MSEESNPQSDIPPWTGARRLAGLAAGPALFGLITLLPTPAGLSGAAWQTAAVAAWMALWWMTEAVPLAATALLPLVLFPSLGIAPIAATAAPYANPLIFLFLGGFLLALTLQRWNLHRRIALAVLARAGGRPRAVVGAFMFATAAISMWVSNTATAAMMVPLALSVLAVMDSDDDDFGRALLLAIAYGASIGGVATLVGTPPNALLAAFMEQTYGVKIGFAQWMIVGLPFALVMLALTWWLLTRILFRLQTATAPEAAAALAAERAALAPMSRPEIMAATLFALTALAWLFRPLANAVFPFLHLTDPGIAMAAAILLFALPVDLRNGEFLLNWDWARRTPWNILMLFGGGLALADAIAKTGLAGWLGASFGELAAWPGFLVLVGVVTTIVFLTEITSNTATAASFLPVVAAVAVRLGENPLLFAVPTAIGASCAFMMPVATPPNAIVFGSGRLRIADMARAGVWMNLIGIIVITALAYGGLRLAFGVVPGVLPGWAVGRP